MATLDTTPPFFPAPKLRERLIHTTPSLHESAQPENLIYRACSGGGVAGLSGWIGSVGK